MSEDKIITAAQEKYHALLKNFKSVILGTSNADGTPDASYSPAVMDDDRNFYVYISEMSSHTRNIMARDEASLMVIEDENSAEQIYARKRATFDCKAEELPHGSADWQKIVPLFKERFGKIFDSLLEMGDFHLFALRPTKGRLVVGFGRAFDITGEKLDRLEHVKGIDSKGHLERPKSHGSSSPITPEAAQRMIEHMNSDHSDSVLMYARHFGGRREAQSAVLKSITPDHMEIVIDTVELLRITFPHKLADSHDAHMTLVKMSKEARQALEAALAG